MCSWILKWPSLDTPFHHCNILFPRVREVRSNEVSLCPCMHFLPISYVPTPEGLSDSLHGKVYPKQQSDQTDTTTTYAPEHYLGILWSGGRVQPVTPWYVGTPPGQLGGGWGDRAGCGTGRGGRYMPLSSHNQTRGPCGVSITRFEVLRPAASWLLSDRLISPDPLWPLIVSSKLLPEYLAKYLSDGIREGTSRHAAMSQEEMMFPTL